MGRQSGSEARPAGGPLPGRDDEEPTVFMEGLSGYMAFERALTTRDRDILWDLPSKAVGSRFFKDFSKVMTLGYHCVHKMNEYEELWKAEERKAHLAQVEVDRFRAEGQRVAEISRRNVEKSRRLFLEKDNLVMEVTELKEDLASAHAELEREKGEFEVKVQCQIDQHMVSRKARLLDIDFGVIEPDEEMISVAAESQTPREEAEQPPAGQNQEAGESLVRQDQETEQVPVAQDQEAERVSNAQDQEVV
ncbi:hypothetical protein U1Q18_021811 [Sarracenia purpurea var. burkii]